MHFNWERQGTYQDNTDRWQSNLNSQDRNFQLVGGKRKWNNADWHEPIHLHLQLPDLYDIGHWERPGLLILLILISPPLEFPEFPYSTLSH